MCHTDLEASSQELILDFQEIALALFTLEWFIDDLESNIVLDILPTAIAMPTKAAVKELQPPFVQGRNWVSKMSKG